MHLIDIVAVVFSIIGTVLFSLWGSKQISRFCTNILYLSSSAMMIYAFGIRSMYPYVLLQSVFLVCSCIGTYRNRNAIDDIRHIFHKRAVKAKRRSFISSPDCCICGAKNTVELRKNISESITVRTENGPITVQLHGLDSYTCKKCGDGFYTDESLASLELQVQAAKTIHNQN